MNYRDQLVDAMGILGEIPESIFLGQAVSVEGTAMSSTLIKVNKLKLMEFPVEEDFQLGTSIGLALSGYLPVTIFPRWNFVLLATNQLVNHLDKLHQLMPNSVPPKVLIRTGIGSVNPLDPGPQHSGDFTEAYKLMCPNLNIVRLDYAEMIIPEYKKAIYRTDGVSTILIEWSDKYYE